MILGVAAVWDERKGLNDFVNLSRTLDSSKYQTVIVGVTEEQKKELPRQIIALTRTNNVEELRMLYSMADVFVNPTYEDNYPTVNLEAEACGTPVITYKTGGSGEAVGKECGCAVEQGNLKKLQEAIEAISLIVQG